MSRHKPEEAGAVRLDSTPRHHAQAALETFYIVQATSRTRLISSRCHPLALAVIRTTLWVGAVIASKFAQGRRTRR